MSHVTKKGSGRIRTCEIQGIECDPSPIDLMSPTLRPTRARDPHESYHRFESWQHWPGCQWPSLRANNRFRLANGIGSVRSVGALCFLAGGNERWPVNRPRVPVSYSPAVDSSIFTDGTTCADAIVARSNTTDVFDEQDVARACRGACSSCGSYGGIDDAIA